MTATELKDKTKRDLVELAKQLELPGWRAMDKDGLVTALANRYRRLAKTTSAKQRASKSANPRAPKEASKRGGTLESLQAKSKAELSEIAQAQGIAGWHSLKKDELVTALMGGALPSRSKPARPPIVQGAARKLNGAGSSVEERVEQSKFTSGSRIRSLAQRMPKDLPTGYGKDRIVVMVRDPFWLHVYWELTHKTIQRSEAALGQDWYVAKPILRLVDVRSDDTTGSTERVLRDIPIHGGVNNWYLEVSDPPGVFRVDIGYVTPSGRFFLLAKSNIVSTPKPGASDHLSDQNWAAIETESDRVFALSGGDDPRANSNELKNLFEERFRRPMSSSRLGDYTSGAFADLRTEDFHFRVDAELIVYGNTRPGATVSVQGEPVQLRPDGSFTMRFALPEGRQILPAVARAVDGAEVRTIILAVERNTKELEPMLPDSLE